MDVKELVTRFPEIPRDLHDDPVLQRFAAVFGGLLRVARNPSPCATQHSPSNHYYLKLIGPMAIYGYGLSTREKVVAKLQEILNRYDADPDEFPASLLPGDTADSEVRGPGCS